MKLEKEKLELAAQRGKAELAQSLLANPAIDAEVRERAKAALMKMLEF